MKIPLITRLIGKRRRSKLRAANTGYKILKNEGKLGFWVELLDSVTNTRLNNANLPFFLLRKNGINSELSIRQFIFVRPIYSKTFYRELLCCISTNKSLKYPLPKEWQNIVINTKRIQVDKFSCTMLWYGYGFFMWVYGVYQGFKGMCCLLRVPKKLGRYIYFHNLIPGNIPVDNKAHTIVNWYFQWKNRVNDIDTVCHSISDAPDTKYSRTDITYTVEAPYLNGIQTIKYYFWFIYLSMHSLLVGLFNPYPAIMLNESIKLVRVRLAKKNQLARDYLFHVSGAYYRPLWTYEAESKGSRVLFYFYSTNGEVFKTTRGYPIQYPWHLMSWPHYLVWDEYQVDFVKRFAHGNPTIEDVGPIWFSSNDVEISVPLNSIAVFDVTPFRPAIYISMGLGSEYNTFNIANQFLSDIQSVLSQYDIGITHKEKRENKHADRRYMRKIGQLAGESNYMTINPNVDALQIIQKTKACISMPFTSTALIAKSEGKSSIYYDPSGMIQKDDRAAHGIPVLSGIDELKEWVEGLNL